MLYIINILAFSISFSISSLLVRYLIFNRHINYIAEEGKEIIDPFSLEEYFSRIEREYIKILEAKENEPKYTIILWIGLNGIRMNEDGSLEWINRRNESVKKR